MKSQFKYLVSILLVFFWTMPAFSQFDNGDINVRFSIPEIAVLDIEPALGNISFSLNAAADPGDEPVVEQVSGESIWINYSSAIRKNGHKRSITAQISGSGLPKGISFSIQASASSAFGSANQGVSAGKVNISNSPRPIITGIGSCYTGDGVNFGHELKYFIEITDFDKIKSVGDQVFTVLYTITDN